MEPKDTEEFNNFLHRVSEVSDIIKNLSSRDPYLEKVGQLEADKFLNKNFGSNINLEDIDEDNVQTKITFDRSVINEKATKKEENCDEGTMSKESFMAEVSKDADRRYKDRLVRMEKMETIKKRANSAFRKGDYEKALCLYNKAIEKVKDSPLLYNNRCLTYINLKIFDKAVDDAEIALKLSEGCLRSLLLLAKAYFFIGEKEKYKEVIGKAKSGHEKYHHFIIGFEKGLEDYLKRM